MTDKTEMIFLHESVRESLVSDIGTFATLASIIGLGVYLESSAMQWAGFIMVSMGIIGRAARMHKGKVRYTPQEAADYLHETYGVTVAEAVEAA